MLLRECGLLDVLLPEIAPQLAEHPGLLDPYLHEIDRAVASGDVPVNAVLLVTLFLPDLLSLFELDSRRQAAPLDHISDLLGPLCSRLRVARRDVDQAKHLLLVQRRITQARLRGGKLPPSVLHRDEMRPAFGLHALVYRVQRLEAGVDEATIAKEIAAWPFPGPYLLGGDGDGPRREFAPDREPRGGDRRRRRRSFDGEESEPPAAPTAAREATIAPPSRAASSGDDEPLLYEEEAALAAFVAAMRSGRDEED